MKQRFLLALLMAIVSLVAKAQTWAPQVSNTFNHLLSLHFTDDQNGCAVGTNGVILKTTNSGTNWVQQSSGTGNSLYSTFFTSPLNGWAVGDGGTIQQTTDGGITWNQPGMPAGFADLRVVWFLNPNIGFIAGGFSGTTATIIKTTNGGATWTDVSPNTGQVIYGIFFTSPLIGYASDFNGNMLKTTNGGTTWNDQFVSPNNLHGIYFTDANTGYVAGGTGGSDLGVILKTTDAGNTWNLNYSSPAFLTDVKFFGPNKGFAVGGSVANNVGLILKTTDAGNSWTTETINPGPTSRQFRVFMPSAQVGFSCGLNGTILRTPATIPCVPDLSADLTGYFPFNGNTDDTSPTAINGVGFDLSPDMGHDGVPNSAFQFNGSSSWIDAGTDNRGVTSAVSVVAWVRTTEQNLGQWVLGKYRYEEDRGYVLAIGNGLNQNIGQVLFGGRDGTSGPGVGHLSGYSNKLVNDGAWHCLTGIAADNQWEVYVDGTLENSALGSTIDMSTSQNVPLTIGFQLPASPVWMNGSMDDIRIYNRRLTDCEIKELCTVAPSLILPPPGASTVACLSTAQVVPDPPVVTNTCGELIVPSGPVASADPICSGEKTYTWTYTDCTGITEEWLYTYTITPPTFSIPALGGSTVACLSATQVVPTHPVVNNSCDDPMTVTGPVISADPACSGEMTYTWTYTDCTGFTADWVYTYTINPPTFSLPADEESTVACLAAAQVVPVPPAVNNSCGAPMIVTGPEVSADPICSGRKSYTWHYTDCTGATAEWEYVYTVLPLAFSLPAPGSSTVACVAAAQVAPTPPVVNSSCGDLLSVTGPVVSADPACSGTKTYVWTYKDCTGNTANWIYTYTINPPTFSLPAPGSSTVACVAAAQAVPTPPAVNSSCGDLLSVTGPVVSADPACSGTKTYTWSYEDCTSNTANWVYTYTINPPAFSLPAPGSSTVACIAAAQVVPTPPAVNSSCGDVLLVTGPVVSANPLCSGTKTYTWSYKDCTGNTANWVYTYTINAPTFNLPAPSGSTANCIGTQVVPVPPVVTGSCGNPVMVTGPVVSANPSCIGTKTYTWTYSDCAGHTADWVYTYTILPEPACDIKMVNCIKYELLSITEDAHHNHSFRIRVTNNCSNKLSYFAVQLPDGVPAKAPQNDAIITAEGGRHYKVRSPNYSPFYSLRFSSQADSLFNGQSEIFEYKLPPQAGIPTFLHVIVRLEPQVFYEAHLNTFGCEINHSSNRQQSEENAGKLRQRTNVVYPNPNSGNFTLELSEPATFGMSFRLVDLTGKLMASQDAIPGTSVQSFQASELPPGLYFLQIHAEGKLVAVEKFAKQ